MTTGPDSDAAPQGLEETLRRFVEEHRDAHEEMLEELRKITEAVSGLSKQADSRHQGITADLGILKGGYALNTAIGNASRIANELGYQFISRVPEQELRAFARLVAAAGEPKGEVQSFSNADMVLLVEDPTRQPLFLAIEVSYTVEADDIRRAKRNAEYLQRVTTMASRGAVVGVQVSHYMQVEAEANQVAWLRERPT